MRHRSQRQNLKGLREGRRQAYEAVVCQHYKQIYRFMAYLTGHADLAEDLTQETFVSAWASIGNYKGRASLGTWLHRIAYNKFIDSRRKLGRDTTLMAELKGTKRDAPQTSDPYYLTMADEQSRFLYKAMHRLGSSEYLVIVLHYIQGLSFRQMAEVLDEPAGTVKWRTSRALKGLREFLTGRE